jgi:hypothetical protein
MKRFVVSITPNRSYKENVASRFCDSPIELEFILGYIGVIVLPFLHLLDSREDSVGVILS